MQVHTVRQKSPYIIFIFHMVQRFVIFRGIIKIITNLIAFKSINHKILVTLYPEGLWR